MQRSSVAPGIRSRLEMAQATLLRRRPPRRSRGPCRAVRYAGVSRSAPRTRLPWSQARRTSPRRPRWALAPRRPAPTNAAGCCRAATDRRSVGPLFCATQGTHTHSHMARHAPCTATHARAHKHSRTHRHTCADEAHVWPRTHADPRRQTGTTTRARERTHARTHARPPGDLSDHEERRVPDGNFRQRFAELEHFPDQRPKAEATAFAKRSRWRSEIPPCEGLHGH